MNLNILPMIPMLHILVPRGNCTREEVYSLGQNPCVHETDIPGMGLKPTSRISHSIGVEVGTYCRGKFSMSFLGLVLG